MAEEILVDALLNLELNRAERQLLEFAQRNRPKIDIDAVIRATTVKFFAQSLEKSFEKIAEDFAKKISEGVKFSFPRQGGGLFSFITEPLKEVRTGIFEGIGRELSRNLGIGISKGLEEKFAASGGSEFIGKQLATNLNKSINKALTTATGIKGNTSLTEAILKPFLGKRNLEIAQRLSSNLFKSVLGSEKELIVARRVSEQKNRRAQQKQERQAVDALIEQQFLEISKSLRNLVGQQQSIQKFLSLADKTVEDALALSSGTGNAAEIAENFRDTQQFLERTYEKLLDNFNKIIESTAVKELNVLGIDTTPLTHTAQSLNQLLEKFVGSVAELGESDIQSQIVKLEEDLKQEIAQAKKYFTVALQQKELGKIQNFQQLRAKGDEISREAKKVQDELVELNKKLQVLQDSPQFFLDQIKDFLENNKVISTAIDSLTKEVSSGKELATIVKNSKKALEKGVKNTEKVIDTQEQLKINAIQETLIRLGESQPLLEALKQIFPEEISKLNDTLNQYLEIAKRGQSEIDFLTSGSIEAATEEERAKLKETIEKKVEALEKSINQIPKIRKKIGTYVFKNVDAVLGELSIQEAFLEQLEAESFVDIEDLLKTYQEAIKKQLPFEQILEAQRKLEEAQKTQVKAQVELGTLQDLKKLIETIGTPQEFLENAAEQAGDNLASLQQVYSALKQIYGDIAVPSKQVSTGSVEQVQQQAQHIRDEIESLSEIKDTTVLNNLYESVKNITEPTKELMAIYRSVALSVEQASGVSIPKLPKLVIGDFKERATGLAFGQEVFALSKRATDLIESARQVNDPKLLEEAQRAAGQIIAHEYRHVLQDFVAKGEKSPLKYLSTLRRSGFLLDIPKTDLNKLVLYLGNTVAEGVEASTSIATQRAKDTVEKAIAEGKSSEGIKELEAFYKNIVERSRVVETDAYLFEYQFAQLIQDAVTKAIKTSQELIESLPELTDLPDTKIGEVKKGLEQAVNELPESLNTLYDRLEQIVNVLVEISERIALLIPDLQVPPMPDTPEPWLEKGGQLVLQEEHKGVWQKAGDISRDITTNVINGALIPVAKTLYEVASGAESAALTLLPFGRQIKAIGQAAILPAATFGAVATFVPGGGLLASGAIDLAQTAIAPLSGMLTSTLTTAINGAVVETLGSVPLIGGQLAGAITAATTEIIGTSVTTAAGLLAAGGTAVAGGQIITKGTQKLAQATVKQILPGVELKQSRARGALSPSTELMRQSEEITAKALQSASKAIAALPPAAIKVVEQLNQLSASLKPVALPQAQRLALPPASQQEVQKIVESQLNVKGLRETLKNLKVPNAAKFNRSEAIAQLNQLAQENAQKVFEAVNKISFDGVLKEARRLFKPQASKASLNEDLFLEGIKDQSAKARQIVQLFDQLPNDLKVDFDERLDDLNAYINSELRSLRQFQADFKVSGQGGKQISGFQSQLKEIQTRIKGRQTELKRITDLAIKNASIGAFAGLQASNEVRQFVDSQVKNLMRPTEELTKIYKSVLKFVETESGVTLDRIPELIVGEMNAQGVAVGSEVVAISKDLVDDLYDTTGKVRRDLLDVLTHELRHTIQRSITGIAPDFVEQVRKLEASGLKLNLDLSPEELNKILPYTDITTTVEQNIKASVQGAVSALPLGASPEVLKALTALMETLETDANGFAIRTIKRLSQQIDSQFRRGDLQVGLGTFSGIKNNRPKRLDEATSISLEQFDIEQPNLEIQKASLTEELLGRKTLLQQFRASRKAISDANVSIVNLTAKLADASKKQRTAIKREIGVLKTEITQRTAQLTQLQIELTQIRSSKTLIAERDAVTKRLSEIQKTRTKLLNEIDAIAQQNNRSFADIVKNAVRLFKSKLTIQESRQQIQVNRQLAAELKQTTQSVNKTLKGRFENSLNRFGEQIRQFEQNTAKDLQEFVGRISKKIRDRYKIGDAEQLKIPKRQVDNRPGLFQQTRDAFRSFQATRITQEAQAIVPIAATTQEELTRQLQLQSRYFDEIKEKNSSIASIQRQINELVNKSKNATQQERDAIASQVEVLLKVQAEDQERLAYLREQVLNYYEQKKVLQQLSGLTEQLAQGFETQNLEAIDESTIKLKLLLAQLGATPSLSLFEKISLKARELIKQFGGLRNILLLVGGAIATNLLFQFGGFDQLLIDFARNTVTTTRELDKLNTQLRGLGNSQKDVSAQFQSVVESSNELKIPLLASYKGYVQLKAAAEAAGYSQQQLKDITDGLNTAIAANNLSIEDSQGIYTAVTQIISKNIVSAEELRQQLGERVPGTFELAAQSIGKTTDELNKMLVSGELLAKDFLPLFGRELKNNFGLAAQTVADSGLNSAFNGLRNQVTLLQAKLGEAFSPSAATGLNLISNSLKLVTDNAEYFKLVLEAIGFIALKAVWPVLSGMFVGIITPIKAASASMRLFATDLLLVTRIEGALGGVKFGLTAIATTARSAALAIKGLVFSLGPIAAFIVVFEAITGAIGDITSQAQESARKINDLKNALLELKNVQNSQQPNGQNVAQEIAEQNQQVFKEQLSFGSKVANAISQVNKLFGGTTVNQALINNEIVRESEIIAKNNEILDEATIVRNKLKDGEKVTREEIDKTVQALNALTSTTEETNFKTAEAVNITNAQTKESKQLINSLKELAIAEEDVTDEVAQAINKRDRLTTSLKRQATAYEETIASQRLSGELTAEEADIKLTKRRLENLNQEKQATEAIIVSIKEQIELENQRRIELAKQSGKTANLLNIEQEIFQTEEQKKRYAEAQDRLTEITSSQTQERISLREQENQQQISQLETQYNRALALQSQAEQERLIEIQSSLNAGVISQQEADELKLQSTKERLNRELQIEQINQQQIENLPVSQLEKEEKLRESKLKTAQLTLQLLESEREEQEKIRQSIDAAQTRSHSNRLKQIDLQTEAYSRQEEALDRINNLIQAGADLAKAYNDAANAQIDAQLSRLEYVSGLIDSVRPELSDVQQKAKDAKQKKAAKEQLKAQGYDPSSESLAQFELRIAKAKYELEERQRQLKAQALNREQELAQANLAIEREKLVISQKRSQLEIEKELSELRRSKIEEQKNLRNAASDEERAAIQESIDLIDKELAATSEKSELLDKQYLQEQSILDIKQQQLRIEQESANAQLQAEQDLERWRSRNEYTSQGGKITDLQPRRDPNLQYGQRQSFEDLNRKYPTQIPIPQAPDLSKAFERGNQSIVTKLDTLIQATKARPLAQVTNNVELTNKIDRDTDASLLRKTRSQTLEDFTSLFKKSINAIV